MGSIGSNLQEVRVRLARACTAAGRGAHIFTRVPEEVAQADAVARGVTLLAVSKTFGADAVREAHAAGARAFGENYVQEALAKIEALADLRAELQWHLIGPLQSNKTRPVAESFDWVHTVDRLKIAERLAAQRPATLPPLCVCLQVNVSGEASKSGVAPAELPALARAVAALAPERLRLRGLMSIPEPTDDAAAQQRQHRALRELFEALRAEGLALDTLSMGMSADLEAAVAEGATIVRVGSAIFGARTYARE
ncbi:MAG: YggS family pyridoxal phosphate-dependent enzyme [Betaproteobacteria bacterium]|jgi:pyridoxal phosphate enzyme (YggS family)|nr:YggS family pyridoxal phosphate-dependent enzyme [Betaproteobacteria bacterium]